jgi:hypothetical protein
MRVLFKAKGWEVRSSADCAEPEYAWASHLACVEVRDTRQMVYSWYMDEPTYCQLCKLERTGPPASVPPEIQVIVKLHNIAHGFEYKEGREDDTEIL